MNSENRLVTFTLWAIMVCQLETLAFTEVYICTCDSLFSQNDVLVVHVKDPSLDDEV